MIKKKAIVLCILVTLLFLTYTSPAFAASDRWEKAQDSFELMHGPMKYIIIAGCVILLFSLIEGGNNFACFPGDAGDVVFKLQDFSASSVIGGNSPGSAISGDSLNYDIDWLLTDRREGRIWATSGITLEFPYTMSGSSFRSAEIAGNFKMGYRNGSWDYNLYFYAPTSDDPTAIAWIAYSY